MWKKLLEHWSYNLEFQPPAHEELLLNAETDLKHQLPFSLRSLLLEANGIFQTMPIPGRVQNQVINRLIWSVDELLRENIRLRIDSIYAVDYASFEDIVFFGSPGVDGILFGIPVLAGSQSQETSVIAWYPINDEREIIAASIADFLTGWLGNTIAI